MSLQDLLSSFGTPDEPPKYPVSRYSKDGDCVFFYNESADYFRERVDGLLTVYRARDNNRIIGLQVKGVRSLPRHDLIGVEVYDGVTSPAGQKIDAVNLLLITLQKPQEADPGNRTLAYREAMQTFDTHQVENAH